MRISIIDENGNPKTAEVVVLGGGTGADGNPIGLVGVADVIHIWTGIGTTNAPVTNVASGAIGFNQDGVSTANVYVFDIANATWRDTTQTVAGFFGV